LLIKSTFLFLTQYIFKKIYLVETYFQNMTELMVLTLATTGSTTVSSFASAF